MLLMVDYCLCYAIFIVHFVVEYPCCNSGYLLSSTWRLEEDSLSQMSALILPVKAMTTSIYYYETYAEDGTTQQQSTID